MCFNNPDITLTFENPNHQSSAFDNMEIVITETQTQTINPPPSIDTNMILSSMCIEIFESFMELVDARRNDIHLVNYSFKWLHLRKLIDCALDSLQEMVVASQHETQKEWFYGVCRSMDEMELRTYYSTQISYSQLLKEYETPQEDEIPEVPDIVKSGFQCSCLSHILKKPDPIILKSQDPEVISFQDKLQAELDAMKLKQEALEKKIPEQQ